MEDEAMILLEGAMMILEGTGWEVESAETLICPCGDTLEWDANCIECGPNPLMAEGLI